MIKDLLTTVIIAAGVASLVLILTGCSVITKVSKANDTALQGAETILCRGASVGSIMRKYGSDPQKAAAWRTLCISSNEAKILTP